MKRMSKIQTLLRAIFIIGLFCLTIPHSSTMDYSGEMQISFVSARDGNYNIYVMDADGNNARRLSYYSSNERFPKWSPDRKKIAFTSDRDGNFEIYVMNSDGSNIKRLTKNSADDLEPAWSPDGTKIAFASDRDGNFEIYVMNSDGSDIKRLTKNSADELEPAWSPDGTKIAFASNRDGNFEIYVMNANGGNQVNLTDNHLWDSIPAWSPDGTKIAFASDRDGDFEIYVMNANGSNKVNLTKNSKWDSMPAWSPDGIGIAFTSNRDGNFEIYVMNAYGSDIQRLTNNSAEDFDPAWCSMNENILRSSAESKLQQAESAFENYEFQDASNLAAQAKQIYELLGVEERIIFASSILRKYETAIEAEILLTEGNDLLKTGDPEAAKQKLSEARQKFQECGLTQKVAEIEYLILQQEAEMLLTEGITFFEQQQYSQANLRFEKALAAFTELQEEESIQECKQWIASCKRNLEILGVLRSNFSIVGVVILALLSGIAAVFVVTRKKKKEVRKIELHMQKLDEMLEKELISQREYEIAADEIGRRLMKLRGKLDPQESDK